MRIYRSGFALLPVVAKLDRYGDLGRDKSFPFTPNIYHVTRNSNSSVESLALFVNFPKFLNRSFIFSFRGDTLLNPWMTDSIRNNRRITRGLDESLGAAHQPRWPAPCG